MSLYQKFWLSYEIDESQDRTSYVVSRYDSRLELARIDSTHELFDAYKRNDATLEQLMIVQEQNITADERDSLDMLFEDLIFNRDDWSDFVFEVDI